MSTTLSIVIAVVTVLNVLACGWLIWWTARATPGRGGQGGSHRTCLGRGPAGTQQPDAALVVDPVLRHHRFLPDLLCAVPGPRGFRQPARLEQAGAVRAGDGRRQRQYAPIYAAFREQDIPTLATNPKALALGHSLFLNNCINCHGSDARGATGFPNLTDNDWLHGGEPREHRRFDHPWPRGHHARPRGCARSAGRR